MAYLPTGAISSPHDVRVMSMASYILTHRGLGKSDFEIRGMLEKQSGLKPALHPCSDVDGKNLCTMAEIEKAFVLTTGGEQAPAPIPEGIETTHYAIAGIKTSHVLLAGGAIVALWLAYRRKQ